MAQVTFGPSTAATILLIKCVTLRWPASPTTSKWKAIPTQRTTFDVITDIVPDRRQIVPTPSGSQVLAHFKSDLGDGWLARGELDYITSFGFREQYTESFNEAVFSETHSVGFLTKHWSDYGINFVTQRNVDYQSTTPKDEVDVRKLPEIDFTQREHQFDVKGFPFWFSFDSSAGLMSRSQPLYQTRQFVDRLDFAPRVTTAFHLPGGIQLVPSVGIRETSYGSSFLTPGVVTGQNVLRNSQDANVALILPSLRTRLQGAGLDWRQNEARDRAPHHLSVHHRHRQLSSKIIHFDESDVLTNTNQVEFSLANRLLAKDKNGVITDFVTWQVFGTTAISTPPSAAPSFPASATCSPIRSTSPATLFSTASAAPRPS